MSAKTIMIPNRGGSFQPAARYLALARRARLIWLASFGASAKIMQTPSETGPEFIRPEARTACRRSISSSAVFPAELARERVSRAPEMSTTINNGSSGGFNIAVQCFNPTGGSCRCSFESSRSTDGDEWLAPLRAVAEEPSAGNKSGMSM